MNDKELLQKIKNVRTAVKEIYGNVNTITYPIYMVDWLIYQAERTEYYMGLVEHRTDLIKQKEQEYRELVAQLQQAQVKIERCKEIFKDIREASSDIYALRKAEQALQTLEGEG